MKVFRISKQKYINDLSGTGASLFPGRWNSKGKFILYTAQSAALALLESVVHLNELPDMQYSLATIVIPDHSIITISEKDLPANWTTFPPVDSLKKFGDKFLAANIHLALMIPSAIMPEENNLLINPGHADFNQVVIERVREITMDQRLFY